MDKDLIINLYKEQFNIICLYLIKCGCRTSDVEDIVQDSFIKAMEYITEVNNKSYFFWNNYRASILKKELFQKTAPLIFLILRINPINNPWS
ncbi:hypothetical protein [Clostridium tertium]|uniref:Uncharacterized protein n=1 Tax=Clostridium tertium TaxID=1559 RepID=A0A6N2ZVY9_9CLOT